MLLDTLGLDDAQVAERWSPIWAAACRSLYVFV